MSYRLHANSFFGRCIELANSWAETFDNMERFTTPGQSELVLPVMPLYTPSYQYAEQNLPRVTNEVQRMRGIGRPLRGYARAWYSQYIHTLSLALEPMQHAHWPFSFYVL